MMRFEGKVALVTGGASGIGRAAVLRFAQVVAEVEARGRRALAVLTDVSDEAQVARMVAATMERFGHFDVLFNNAGIGGGSDPIKDMSIEEWDRVIAVNLRGVMLGCKFALPAMIRSGGGAIVNMASSMAGGDTLAGGSAYMASKEGVTGLTKSLALEAAGYGIRVNAVCPGIIETPLSFGQGGLDEAAWREWFGRFAQRIPLRRVGRPEDVAAAVAFLASDDAPRS